MAHLADAEILFGYRIRQVLADKDPQFSYMDQDAWARHLGYMEAAIPELIAQFGVNRYHHHRLLTLMPSEDYSKRRSPTEHKRQRAAE